MQTLTFKGLNKSVCRFWHVCISCFYHLCMDGMWMHQTRRLIPHWTLGKLTSDQLLSLHAKLRLETECYKNWAISLASWPQYTTVIGWQKPNKFMVHVSMSPPDYSLHFYSIYVSSSFILSLFRNPWIKSNLKKVIICKWMKERTLFDSWSTEVDNKDKQSKPTY